MTQDKKKLLMKIISKAVTTAVVVDCPTPLAPPVVVKPQLQPMMAIKRPKQPALIMALQISQVCRKLRADSINTVSAIPYIFVAMINPPTIPVIKDRRVKMGSMRKQARTRGMTK